MAALDHSRQENDEKPGRLAEYGGDGCEWKQQLVPDAT
jgi:hypothetical protein